MGMIEGKVSELEDRNDLIGRTERNNQKKMNRALKTGGKIAKGLIFVSLESQMMMRQRCRKIWNNDSKTPKFRERDEFTEPKSSANHEKGKLEENHDQTYHNQIMKTKDKEKNVESNQRKMKYHK